MASSNGYSESPSPIQPLQNAIALKTPHFSNFQSYHAKVETPRIILTSVNANKKKS